MNSRSISRLTLLALGFASCGPLSAADYTDAPTTGAHRISINSRFFFNVSAKVVHGAPADLTGPATGGGIDRTYDDGFVKLDVSGNVGGTTWNWGYQDNSQLIGNGIEQHRTVSPRDGATTDLGSDLSYGGEVGWSWELRRFDIGRREARVGLDLFAGWNQLSGEGSSSVAGNYTVQTDRFAVPAGVTPREAPYAGTFAVNGELLSDSPTRTTSTAAATSQFGGDLDATMIGFRIGPWLEIPLTKKLTWNIGLGLAAYHVDGSYSFTEQLSVGGVPRPAVSGSVDRADWKSGFYIDTRLHWNLTPEWSVFGGVQFQHLGTFKIDGPAAVPGSPTSIRNHQAQVDLESAIGVTAGVSFSF